MTLLLINLGSNTTFSVQPSVRGTLRREWHLASAGRDVHAKEMTLNGNLLQLVNNASHMPPMDGKLVSIDRPIVIEPASLVFAQITTPTSLCT